MRLQIVVIVHDGLVEQAKAKPNMKEAYAYIASYFGIPNARKTDILREIDRRNTSGSWTIQVIQDSLPNKEK